VVFSLVAVVLLLDASGLSIGDGSVPVLVTVDSDRPFRLRKVTYDHYGDAKTVKQVLEFPRENAEYFRDARIQDDQSFQFDVPFSHHLLQFGILQNKYGWLPLAVFRIECDTGETDFVSAAVPDPRTTKSLTIKIP
jgi:hypothetical protein